MKMQTMAEVRRDATTIITIAEADGYEDRLLKYIPAEIVMI